ncbi:HlyD family efflux transporter periplasmic adaptor subunit [Poseidonocella sp. HB161398]|uniref:HlyD family efflux transporter periplasmic adaptor subunit n=1 Tax=Poseidonocella sp. HB161398 TaxID=2320855 RepID=UPI001108436A|nr:HlyD family efflux transporter periplasmic adaptor subunit [Poseidonocella sp. HB161398]
MKKLLAFVLAAALLGGGGWWWFSRGNGEEGVVVLHGNVDIRQVSLAFDGSGRITELGAEEGDAVSRGQVIGKLDTTTLELQARQAEAQVEAARQTLNQLRNGTRPEEIAQARAQLASAEATAERAKQDLARARSLLTSASAAVSGQAVDHAQAEFDVANASVDEARAALELAEAGPREEEIASAEADLAAAEAALALLRHQIDQGTLRAPIDAVVRSRLLEPGDQASASIPVFALAVTDPKWIRLYASETDLGRIRPGQAAEVSTDSHPGEVVEGKVGYISSVAEFTPKSVQTEELRTSLVYEVRVTVDDTENRLRLGQPVTVRLVANDAAAPAASGADGSGS